MNRRTVLALAGAGLSIPGGYVAWNRFQSLSVPDGMHVDTLYVRGNVFGEPAPADHEIGSKEPHHTVIGDEETAAHEVSFAESAIKFADETDFGNSYLSIVQTRMQSEPDLALEAIARTDDGLHLDVAVEHPWWRGVDDDSVTHSLLIRIADDKDGIPESVSVDITGYV